MTNTRQNSPPSPTAAEPDDGPLDSLGKAITDPIETGAEEEEFQDDGSTPVKPGE